MLLVDYYNLRYEQISVYIISPCSNAMPTRVYGASKQPKENTSTIVWLLTTGKRKLIEISPSSGLEFV